jgi:CheY-like chemotaxis protein
VAAEPFVHADANPAFTYGPAASSSRRRVLYISDDEAMLMRVSPRLASMGYCVTWFHDAVEALLLLQDAPWAFELVVIDDDFSEPPEKSLRWAVEQLRSGLPVLLSSGCLSDEPVTGFDTTLGGGLDPDLPADDAWVPKGTRLLTLQPSLACSASRHRKIA